MRQAIVRMVVGLCAVGIVPARGGDDRPSAAVEPTLARARRLIEAGDRTGAVDLLEEALIDGPVGDRPAILDLLRRSYQAMVRDADAAGRAADAAHYRDNLAILERSRQQAGRPAPAPQPAKPAARPRTPRVEPAPAPARAAATSRLEAAAQPMPTPMPKPLAPPPTAVPPSALADPPELRAPGPDPSRAEPSPLPEPARLPTPGPVKPAAPAAGNPGMIRVPPVAARDDGTREIPGGSPMSAPPAAGPDEGAGREALINPGAASGPGRPEVTEAQPRAEARSAAAPEQAEADALFRARRYDQAGRIYAALAARTRLPGERRPHWAYCRFVAVVRRINARPRSPREWDAIEAEIRDIQRLTPGNWYAEYLLNKVAEVRHGRRRSSTSSSGLVVRGSAPDDPSPRVQPPSQRQPQTSGRRRLMGGSRGTSPAPIQPGSPSDGPPGPAGDSGTSLNLPISPSEAAPTQGDTRAEATGDRPRPAPRGDGRGEGSEGLSATPASALSAPSLTRGDDDTSLAWQVHETANFRIHHSDPMLAERAGAIAESVRTAQARRWGSGAAAAAWSPRCELYLYPTARQYADATGQPEHSPGISTMSTNDVKVLSRRMSLRADNPRLLTATLPHEVTHIVLADLFVARQIPRWADEGLAVLAEPEGERRRRQADLKGPLDGGRIFKVGHLMTMDYPAPEDWALFYAQSVSLTQFLVEQGPPQRFIQFVRDLQRQGAEAALRDVYQIDSLAALQERWAAYAREQLAVDVASSRDLDAGLADTRRE